MVRIPDSELARMAAFPLSWNTTQMAIELLEFRSAARMTLDTDDRNSLELAREMVSTRLAILPGQRSFDNERVRLVTAIETIDHLLGGSQ